MRNFSIKNTIWKNPGHEFDAMARDMLDSNKNVVLIGRKKYIEVFKNRNKEICVDYCQEYESSCNLDKKIVDRADECIFVCVAFEKQEYLEIKEFLEKYKICIKENKNYFQSEVYQSIWYVYKKNEIKIDRVEIFLTSSCTLNCEKCIAFIPYFKKNIKTSLESLKRDADLFFSKVDYVYKLKLLGGEGFIYKELPEYIDYLNANYKEKIGSVRIGTNGTVLPNEDIIECCQRNDVIVDISDYTPAVPDICKLDEVIQILEKKNIKYDVKRVGEQWLDLGFPTNVAKEKTEDELRNHFFKCAMFCRDFYDGKLYYCCANFAAIKSGMFKENENDYFDFKREFSKKELLEYELGYSRLGHTTFCNVCNGCSEEANSLFVPVAKQMQ